MAGWLAGRPSESEAYSTPTRAQCPLSPPTRSLAPSFTHPSGRPFIQIHSPISPFTHSLTHSLIQIHSSVSWPSRTTNANATDSDRAPGRPGRLRYLSIGWRNARATAATERSASGTSEGGGRRRRMRYLSPPVRCVTTMSLYGWLARPQRPLYGCRYSRPTAIMVRLLYSCVRVLACISMYSLRTNAVTGRTHNRRRRQTYRRLCGTSACCLLSATMDVPMLLYHVHSNATRDMPTAPPHYPTLLASEPSTPLFPSIALTPLRLASPLGIGLGWAAPNERMAEMTVGTYLGRC
jgi:hypothetical protein